MKRICPICGGKLHSELVACPHCLQAIDLVPFPRLWLLVPFALFLASLAFAYFGRETLAVFAMFISIASCPGVVLLHQQLAQYVPARRCRHCGYNLIDKEDPKICTECGKNPNL